MYRKPGVQKEGMSHLYELGLLCETCSDTETVVLAWTPYS